MLDFSWLKTRPTQHLIAYDVDCNRLFSYLKTKDPHAFFFESLAIPRHQDRYASMGFAPAVLVYAKDNKLIVEGAEEAVFQVTGERKRQVSFETHNPYQLLKQSCDFRHEGPAHAGGLVGYFCHESVNYFEPSIELESHAHFSNFKLGLYYDGLVYDTTTGTLNYYSYAQDRSDQIKQLLNDALTFEIPTSLAEARYQGQSVTKDEFLAAVKRTKQKITEGYSFQAEVGFKSFYQIKGDKNAIYQKLRQINPSPYMFYVTFAEEELLGASPEILISAKQGRVLTTPTAGTTVRGKTEHEDTLLARKLLQDPKEIAEHNMLVDLHRNDLSTICMPGSVKISDLMYIIRFSHVQHIVSNVEGTLEQDKDAFDVLASILPGGVVSGAPKIETIKIIEENENAPRGPYGGAVGRFSFNGDADFCLPIRSIFCSGDDCFVQTSAGVVYDSVPQKEYEEVNNKLAAMKQTLSELGAT